MRIVLAFLTLLLFCPPSDAHYGIGGKVILVLIGPPKGATADLLDPSMMVALIAGIFAIYAMTRMKKALAHK